MVGAMVMNSTAFLGRILSPPKRLDEQLQVSGHAELSMPQYPSSNSENITLRPHVNNSAIADEINDWTFQDVDLSSTA